MGDMPTDPQTLAHRFDAPGVSFESRDGLPLIRVRTDAAEADVFLHGAHVTHFKPADQDRGLLFLSESAVFAKGKAIRGGIPICFPWFAGNGPKDKPDAPAHGFARAREWTLADVRADGGDVVLSFSLNDDEATRKLWPHAFQFAYVVRVGRELTVTAEVVNAGVQECEYELALHTYLSVADARRATLAGFDGVDYISKVEGGERKTQRGEPKIEGEIDRVYQGQTADVVVTDPVLNRAITVSKTGGDSTILWNPHVEKAKRMSDFGDDEWPAMLCVESAAVGEKAIRLAPGESHALSLRLSCSPAA